MTVPGWPTCTAAACAKSWSPAEDQYLLELLARSGPERRCVGPPLADLMAQRFGRAYNHQQIWLRLTQICPASSNNSPQSKISSPVEATIAKQISRLEENASPLVNKVAGIDAMALLEKQAREKSESELKSKRNPARSGSPAPRGGSKWRQEEMAALVQFVDTEGKDWATIADLMTSRFGTRYRRYSHFTVEFKWRYMKRLQPAQFERCSKPSSEGEESETSPPSRPRCFSESDIPAKKARTMVAQPVMSQWGDLISSARLETVDHFVNRIFATSNDDHFNGSLLSVQALLSDDLCLPVIEN